MSGAPFEHSMSRRQALNLLGASAIVPFDTVKATASPSSEALHYIGLQEAGGGCAKKARGVHGAVQCPFSNQSMRWLGRLAAIRHGRSHTRYR